MALDPHQDTIDVETSLHGGGAALNVGLTLLQHPEAERVGQIAPLFSAARGGVARISRLEPEFRHAGNERSEALASPVLSRNPLIVSSTERGTLSLDARGEAIKARVDGQPFSVPREFSPERLEHGIVIELSESVVLLLHLVSTSEEREDSTELIGGSLGIRRVWADIRRVADADIGVLIRGETGSGKELVARAIHAQSRRRDGPYVAVNMGAIPTSLAASLLFGYERGAFSGATRSAPGFFGAAGGGTLFLDEVGETPPEVQPLLLRALREGEIQRVGRPNPEPVDVRVVCATDAHLEAMVEQQEFSMALLRRIDGYPIQLPPLRERRDDIARLFYRFLRSELRKIGEEHKLARVEPSRRPWVPARVLTALLEYHWPGNVAELETLAKRIVIDNQGLEHFELSAGSSRKLGLEAGALPQVRTDTARRNAGALRDADIVEAMREHAFKVAATAAALGVSKTWLNQRLEHCHGLRKAKDLTRAEIDAAEQSCGGLDISRMARALEVSEHGLKLRIHDLNAR